MRFPSRFTGGSSLLFLVAALSLPVPAATGVYRIQPGDTVEVQYRYTPEFNATAAIQPDGSVSLPLVGRLELVGNTAEEASAIVRTKASERLRDPEVTVILRDYTKPSYTVAGEVLKPGIFDCRGEVTLMRALASAGWFKESSKHSQVVLVRRVNAEWGEARAFNIKRKIGQKSFAEDPLVQPGDLIVVPQNALSKIDRYFRWAAFANLGFLLR